MQNQDRTAIYLLTPLSLEHRDWRRSSHRGALQVEAPSEYEARTRATLFTAIAINLQPGDDIGDSPWGQPELVSVSVVPAVDPNLPFIRLQDKPDDSPAC